MLTVPTPPEGDLAERIDALYRALDTVVRELNSRDIKKEIALEDFGTGVPLEEQYRSLKNAIQAMRRE